MKRTVLFFAVLALVVTFASAPAIAQEKPQVVQDASKEVKPAALPEQNVTGAWEGELKHPRGLSPVEVEFRLKQNGETLSGVYDWRGPFGGGSNIAVAGTVKGNKLSGTIPSIAYSSIELTIDGDRMEGTFVGSSGRSQQLTLKKAR